MLSAELPTLLYKKNLKLILMNCMFSCNKWYRCFQNVNTFADKGMLQVMTSEL